MHSSEDGGTCRRCRGAFESAACRVQFPATNLSFRFHAPAVFCFCFCFCSFSFSSLSVSCARALSFSPPWTSLAPRPVQLGVCGLAQTRALAAFDRSRHGDRQLQYDNSALAVLGVDVELKSLFCAQRMLSVFLALARSTQGLPSRLDGRAYWLYRLTIVR